MQIFYKIMLTLTIIGGINWGLIGILDFNLVTTLFGQATLLTKIVYSIVGISSIISLALLFKNIEE